MSDFYANAISAALQDKYEYLKYRMLLSMFDEKPREYTMDWSWDLRKPGWMGDAMPDEVKDYRDTLEEAIDSSNQGNMPGNAQVAFNDLITQIKKLSFDFGRPLDFIVFEALFYKLVTDAYRYQRYSAQSEQLISIELAKAILDDDQYAYISLIYEILQLEFNFWMNYRDNFDGNESLKNTKTYRAGIQLNRVESQIGTKEYWNKIKKLASSAHDLFPTGELANRIMLISDIQLIYGLGDWKDVYDPANEELVKYLGVRKDAYGNSKFILDCFSDGFEDYCKPLGWITGLPYLEGRASRELAASKCRSDEERKNFCNAYYGNTMMFPATIYFPQMDGHYLTSIANEIQYSNYLKQTNEELKNKNAALNKAQQEKKQIIAEFAHTYGNMQATTLQDIGTELLSVDDELLHEWGRKIMVEYAIKQNLTKEVEMLKLQFEDQSSKLIQKMKDSLNSYEGKTITDLVSDALQRCFMSLLYGETRSDKSKRKLFFGSENNIEMREALQDSFEQSVLVGEQDMLNWLNEKSILDIPISISEIWKTLCFDDGGYAALLITNWITELLTNAIKYADKSKPISMSFSHENDMLIITISDIKEQSAVNIHGTQQGISSIIASIRRLNLAVECTFNTDELEEDSDSYNLKLFLSSKVLIG